jgi:hypothetical protein
MSRPQEFAKAKRMVDRTNSREKIVRRLGANSRSIQCHPAHDEICQILSGSVTITEADGTSFENGPGTLLVMQRSQ